MAPRGRRAAPTRSVAPRARSVGRVFASLVAATAAAVASSGISAAAASTAAPVPQQPDLPGLVSPPASWPRPDLPELAAWILVDGETGQVLGADAADNRRPVASTVKILTALTAATFLDLDEDVVVGDEVLGLEGASASIEPGTTWTVEQLLDALLSRSGNDAAEALAVAASGDRQKFLDAMEAEAQRLGVDDVDLVSVSGLDDANRLSARDLATLGRAILAHPTLRELVGRETVVLPGQGELETRNELLGRYPDATGVKTGFTMAAGNSLVASAERDGVELVAVVLGAGDDPARFEAAEAVLDLGFDEFVRTTTSSSVTMPVGGGAVTFTAPQTQLAVPVTHQTLRHEVILPTDGNARELTATLYAEEAELGLVTMTADDEAPVPSPVTADAAVGRALADGAWAALRVASGSGPLR